MLLESVSDYSCLYCNHNTRPLTQIVLYIQNPKSFTNVSKGFFLIACFRTKLRGFKFYDFVKTPSGLDREFWS